MAYKIQYTAGDKKRYPPQSKQRKLKWGNMAGAVMLIAAGLWFHTNGIPDFLIPGDPQVTREAATDMITQMREGVPIEQAITAFCEQILDGAQQ